MVWHSIWGKVLRELWGLVTDYMHIQTDAQTLTSTSPLTSCYSHITRYMSVGIHSLQAVNTVCVKISHTAHSIQSYHYTSLDVRVFFNPLFQKVVFHWSRSPPITSRWRTRGRFVLGANRGEGQSWWCQSPDPGELKHMHTDWHLALFSVLLVDSVWLWACVYFWPFGKWSQAFNMIQQNAVTHTNHYEHYCSALQHCTEFVQILMKYTLFLLLKLYKEVQMLKEVLAEENRVARGGIWAKTLHLRPTSLKG